MTVKTGRTERVAEIKAQIEGLINLKRAALSDGQHPDRVLREIAHIEKRIEKDLLEVQRMRHRLENWKDIYNDADARITELRKELVQLENEAKIAALKKALEQVNGIDPSALGALLEQMQDGLKGE